MITQLSVQTLKAKLVGDDRPTILDAREPWEVQLCALPGSLHVPMSMLTHRLADLPRDTDLVVVCHHGVRSQMAAGMLQRLGFERLYNLRGGIDAWAREIDPQMPVY